MTNSFYKKLVAYIFSGLAIFIFAALFFVYSQLKDLDNIKNMVVEKMLLMKLLKENTMQDTLKKKLVMV